MDGRRARGERTRQVVAARAAALASVEGLTGLTLSRLADAIGTSKGSIQAAYRTKEELQVAAVGAATDIFVKSVIAPAQDAEEGIPRLLAFVEEWLGYVERRVFPGGCFMVATLSEYDSRPGPVRDALARARRSWLRLLEQQVAVAQQTGALPPEPAPSLLAFEIDALLASANVSWNLSDDISHLQAARTIIGYRLESPSRRIRRRRNPDPDAE